MLLLALALVGELKTFKDWTVGCDNGRTCEAVSLETEGDGVGAVVVRRDGVAKAVPRISVTNDHGPAVLQIDTNRYRVHDGVVEAPDAVQLASALAQAKRIALLDAHDKTLAIISGAGASDALRFMDKQQRRAGTTTALVARGRRTHVPPPPALPVIRVPRASALPPAVVKPEAIAPFVGKNDCNAEPGTYAPDLFRLDATHTLVIVPTMCDRGYNSTSRALVVGNDGLRPRKARFDSPPGWGDSEESRELLVGGWYDPEARRLSSTIMVNGTGVGGVTEHFAWDGKRFRSVEVTVDGMITWRAVVR